MTIRNSILLYKYSKWIILLLVIIISVMLFIPISISLSLPTFIGLLTVCVVGYTISNLISPVIIKWLLSNSKYPVILSKCFEYLSIRHGNELNSKDSYQIENFLKENKLNKTIDIHTFSDIYYLRFSDNALYYKGRSIQWKNIDSWKYAKIVKGRNYVDQISIVYKNEDEETKEMILDSYEMRIYSYELLIMMVAYTYR